MIKKYIKMLFQKYLSDYAYNVGIYNYRRVMYGYAPRIPNIENPRTLNEKILHLKMYYRHPKASIIADKYAVRSYVSEKWGDDILIPLYGVYSDPESIKLSVLPEVFVAKPNHASGMILFCNRAGIRFDEMVRTMRGWLSIDYGELGREYQYVGIERKILLEKDLRVEAGVSDICDYKIFCFGGEPTFIQFDQGRFSGHTRSIFDLEWNRLPFSMAYPTSNASVEKPANLARMIEIASTLSKDLPLARVDLYNLKGKIYFGEITLHPGGGVLPFDPEIFDGLLGAELDLPKNMREN